MSILLKIVAGICALLGVLMLLSAILGEMTGAKLEVGFIYVATALGFAATARLLDDTAAIRSRLEHIQYQLIQEIRTAAGRQGTR
ncbi:hypothetical protein [Inquilinus sp. Marseille-Q2685]|uniref:hypothetical protein n=1 Tax=Inquilinus sp. Marseille-Q2685 TaxID=2866581 RepID=UPI001CE3D6C1|nr:hypothetical protein [Inquilinus sp. Marseille-Q2685]